MVTIQTLVKEIENLTPIPAVVHSLLEVLNNPSASMDDVARIIQYDPAITAKVLRTANSAFFGLKHPVESIKDAAALLGLDQIVDLVLLQSGAGMFDDSCRTGNTPCASVLWKYSVASALIAKQIADRLGMHDPASIFTSCLLKDMGKTVLDKFVRDANEKISALVVHDKLSVMAAEKKVIGVDHAELGAIMAKTWDFSSAMVKNIRFHHAEDSRAMDDINIAVVYLADCICMIMGLNDGTQLRSCRFQRQALKRTGLSVDDITGIVAEASFKLQQVNDLLNVV